MKTDKKFKELEAKAKENLEGWKRAQADYQNLKKEHEEKIQRIGEISAVGFIGPLLPIIDHFDLALSHIPKESQSEEWVQGFYHIKKQFDDILKNLGVKRIKTVGTEFDPELHEAVSQKESSQDEGMVIEELQTGYRFDESIIRHAKVVVSK
jgi:molecular chaperone GrpE